MIRDDAARRESGVLQGGGAGCVGIRRDLEAFVDGELSPARRAVVMQHLESCAGCAGHFDDLAGLGDELRAAARDRDARCPEFAGLASSVIGRVRAESAMSWRARVTRACDDWHWAIVASGSLTATFVSTVIVSIILAFGPAPAREDSLSALMANLGAPAGMLFVCATPSGTTQDAILFQVDNGQPAASRMTAQLAEMACRPVSDADVTGKLAKAVTAASGHALSLETMHPEQRRYIEGLLTEIRARATQPPVVSRAVDVHEVRLVTGMAVVAKAL
jgi:anti-sigma factor RsiW